MVSVTHVIPAKAGFQEKAWIPAFAGMTAENTRLCF